MFVILGPNMKLFVFTLYGEKWSTQSGKIRYNVEMSVTDIIEWTPKGLRWHPYKDFYGKNVSRGNGWGYFYSPIICLDRTFWHKTEIIIKEKDLEQNCCR